MSAISGRHGSVEKHLFAHSDSRRASGINCGGGQVSNAAPHWDEALPPTLIFPGSRAFDNTATLGGAELSRTSHSRYLSHRRNGSLDGIAFTKRQRCGSPLQSSVKLLLRNYENGIGHNCWQGANCWLPHPNANWTCGWKFPPSRARVTELQRESQRLLTSRLAWNGREEENQILPSAQTVLCLFYWLQFIFKNLCHFWALKHDLFLSSILSFSCISHRYIVPLHSSHCKGTIYLPSSWYWPVGTTVQNKLFYRGKQLMCLSGCRCGKNQTAHARSDLWVNVLKITRAILKKRKKCTIKYVNVCFKVYEENVQKPNKKISLCSLKAIIERTLEMMMKNR